MTHQDPSIEAPLLRIETLRGVHGYRLVGELDMSNSSQLQDLGADGPPGDLVLDLSQLNFIDCYGRSTLVQIAFALAERGRLIVRSPAPPVQRLFELTDIHAVPNIQVEHSA